MNYFKERDHLLAIPIGKLNKHRCKLDTEYQKLGKIYLKATFIVAITQYAPKVQKAED